MSLVSLGDQVGFLCAGVILLLTLALVMALAWCALKRELSARRLAVFLLACGVATLAAQKGGVSTNAVPPDAPGGVSGMARALPRPSADVPLAGFDVTNLMFFAIRPGTSAHELGLAWPADAQPCRFIAIFAKAAWTNAWESVGVVDTQYVRSNVVAAVDYPSLSASDSAFFAAAWHKDSDGDGLDDGEELYVYHTDPECADCDGDGLLDGREVNEFETDPWDPDTDGDGLPDGWEVEYDFDPTETTILTGDSDGDGLSDAEEARWGTDPYSSHSDDDSLPDGWEVVHGFDPMSALGDDGDNGDPDGDLMPNWFEYEMGTDPRNPDTDGDGIPDGLDDWPLRWDGDFFGLQQELPSGANPQAYCWIDLVSPSNAMIRFKGDAPSSLADPAFMARGGETNRVTLLIGKTYELLAPHSVEIVARSDEAIEVTEVEGTRRVRWPVSLTVQGTSRGAIRPLANWNDGGASFSIVSIPDWINGRVSWTNETCCPLVSTWYGYRYTCDGTCRCTGCTAVGRYAYEGYALPVTAVPCGCYAIPDEGPAELTAFGFTKSAVFYEDPYTNMPGVVVTPPSSNTVLRCVARGGTYGGRLTVTLVSGSSKVRRVGGLSLPSGAVVDPGEERTFEVEYAPRAPSDAIGDIEARATFVEEFTGTRHQMSATLTSVKVQLEAVYDAPENHNPSRHVYGVGEKVRFSAFPTSSLIRFRTRKFDSGDDDLDYELFDGQEETNALTTSVYTCPIADSHESEACVACVDSAYKPSMQFIEPQMIITPYALWGENAVPYYYQGNRKCWPSGMVGSACLATVNYIGPFNVSFQGVAVSELPCDEEDTVTGSYQTNGHSRTHTVSAGAGKARYVRQGNFWFTDGARQSNFEAVWEPFSVLRWKIPIGWHRKHPECDDWHGVQRPDYEIRFDDASRPLIVGGRNDVYFQQWSIGVDGSVTTTKYGHWIYRSPDCTIILDGHLLQDSHP